jgi:hypothetical protein
MILPSTATVASEMYVRTVDYHGGHGVVVVNSAYSSACHHPRSSWTMETVTPIQSSPKAIPNATTKAWRTGTERAKAPFLEAFGRVA